MKTAIYIEDGIMQLVLTPETEYEKGMIKAFGDKLNRVKVFNGTFYDCRGGWIRQTALKDRGHFSQGQPEDDSSLIMRIDAEEGDGDD